MNIEKINPKKHILSSEQFSKEYLFEVFRLVNDIKKNKEKYNNVLKNKIVAMLFYEPSTRTRLSFESATLYLGGSKITTENASKFSSASKGETIEDSIKVVSAYADFIVMRHFDDNALERALKTAEVPLINAGSGKSQHPTQALLDTYTIYENFKRLDNLKIAFVGDLLRGRTVNSLVHLLSKFDNNEFYFVSPENSKIKKEVKEYLNKNNTKYFETNNLDTVLNEIDILYMTRIQKERFEDEKEYLKAKGKFILNSKNIEKIKKDAIIMHPLPRVDEIEISFDNNSRAKYFEQAKNGLYIRMAILKLLNDNN